MYTKRFCVTEMGLSPARPFAAFASYEIKVALAELIRRYGFRLSGSVPERTVLRNVTLGPAGGVLMLLEHAS